MTVLVIFNLRPVSRGKVLYCANITDVTTSGLIKEGLKGGLFSKNLTHWMDFAYSLSLHGDLYSTFHRGIETILIYSFYLKQLRAENSLKMFYQVGDFFVIWEIGRLKKKILINRGMADWKVCKYQHFFCLYRRYKDIYRFITTDYFYLN